MRTRLRRLKLRSLKFVLFLASLILPILPVLAYAESPLATLDAPYAASFDYGAVAFGSVTTNYAILIANASSHQWKALDCYNGLDKDILISLDGSTTVEFVPSLKGKFLPLLQTSRYVALPLYIKATAAVGSGTLYCTGIY